MKLNHKRICECAKMNDNDDQFDTIEKLTAWAIWQDIDFYSFTKKETIATIEINLPYILQALNLNAKAFADEMGEFGYDIVITKGVGRYADKNKMQFFLQRKEYKTLPFVAK
jgi:hypothetical protein